MPIAFQAWLDTTVNWADVGNLSLALKLLFDLEVSPWLQPSSLRLCYWAAAGFICASSGYLAPFLFLWHNPQVYGRDSRASAKVAKSDLLRGKKEKWTAHLVLLFLYSRNTKEWHMSVNETSFTAQ